MRTVFIVARVVVHSHPPRLAVMKFAELPQRHSVIGLADGSRVKVKKIEAAPSADGADIVIHVKPA